MFPNLTLPLGKDPDGNDVTLDITRAPHTLIAGMTGSGKSSLMNTMLVELFTYHYPEEFIAVLIDPKRVELAPYTKEPSTHKQRAFYETREITIALEWVNAQMDYRYKVWVGHGKDIADINNRLMLTSNSIGDLWPRIVIVVDELANLILSKQGKHIEELLVRIASMGRAAGIHMLLATQRPSADVITGLIRANVPTRLCLPVATKMESRIVLDQPGAELLPGPGEILAKLPGFSRDLVRIKSEYMSTSKIEAQLASITYAA